VAARKEKKKKRSRKKKTRRSAPQELLTLSELARAASVSIPTAQSYKKKYQSRIPSVGSGRKQRYRRSAVAVFQQLKRENLARRGRGGHRGRGPAPTAGAPQLPSNARQSIISLAEIARRTRISYPTLLRYVQLHGRKIPSVGRGRKRRFPQSAVQVFEQLRSQSRRGRGSGAAAGRTATGTDRALAERIRHVEAMQAALARQLGEVVRLLKQPLNVTIRPQ
jgi:excisionase family DNA binding protein